MVDFGEIDPEKFADRKPSDERKPPQEKIDFGGPLPKGLVRKVREARGRPKAPGAKHPPPAAEVAPSPPGAEGIRPPGARKVEGGPEVVQAAQAEWTKKRLDTEFGRIFAAQAAAIEGLKRWDRQPFHEHGRLIDEILPHVPVSGTPEFKALEEQDPTLTEYLETLWDKYVIGSKEVRFFDDTTPGGAIFPRVKKDDRHGGMRIEIGQPIAGRLDRFQVKAYDSAVSLEYLSQEELERIAREHVSLEEILEKRREAEVAESVELAGAERLRRAEEIIAEEFLRQVAPNPQELSAEYLKTMKNAATAFAKQHAREWLAEFEAKSKSAPPAAETKENDAGLNIERVSPELLELVQAYRDCLNPDLEEKAWKIINSHSPENVGTANALERAREPGKYAPEFKPSESGDLLALKLTDTDEIIMLPRPGRGLNRERYGAGGWSDLFECRNVDFSRKEGYKFEEMKVVSPAKVRKEREEFIVVKKGILEFQT